MQLKQQKYLNNVVKQDHPLYKEANSFYAFDTTISILAGVEAIHIFKNDKYIYQFSFVQSIFWNPLVDYGSSKNKALILHLISTNFNILLFLINILIIMMFIIFTLHNIN